MDYAYCIVPVAPLRFLPNHQNEMTSQLLFGEKCTIIEKGEKDWVKIICSADEYEGWCQLSHLKTISADEFDSPSILLVAEWAREIKYYSTKMHVPFGCNVISNNRRIRFSGKTIVAAESNFNETVFKEIAMKFLNTAYLWGGRSVFGIDCSGFSQMVYKFFDVALFRDAKMQATQGELVGFLQEAKCGDLAFFDNPEGEIIHVGILLDYQTIIHASGKVRIDKIDNAGIINADTNLRTQQLRIIKRFISG